MSRRFKRPPALSATDRRNDRQIKVMATQVHNQGMLDALLDGAAPSMRQALLDRLVPYLPFAPEQTTVTADCPRCGLRRGSVIAHECLASK